MEVSEGFSGRNLSSLANELELPWGIVGKI